MHASGKRHSHGTDTGGGPGHSLPKIHLNSAEISQHFGFTDPDEIVSAVGSMGQRELQLKFQDIYHLTTHSTNNHWLRRKLLEAAGVGQEHFTNKGTPVHHIEASSPEPPSPGSAAGSGSLLGDGIFGADVHRDEEVERPLAPAAHAPSRSTSTGARGAPPAVRGGSTSRGRGRGRGARPAQSRGTSPTDSDEPPTPRGRGGRGGRGRSGSGGRGGRGATTPRELPPRRDPEARTRGGAAAAKTDTPGSSGKGKSGRGGVSSPPPGISPRETPRSLGRGAVGKRVVVQTPRGSQQAVVLLYDHASKLHTLQWGSGKVEQLSLRSAGARLVQDATTPAPGVPPEWAAKQAAMDRSGGGPAAVTVSTPTPTEASGGADSASKGARSGGKSNWSPGDLVWGKVKGHGFWPGRVVDPQRHSKVMGMPHSHSSVLVQFFDNTLGWANKVELQDLEANWEKMAVLKKSSAFKDALRTARKAVTHAKARGPVKRRDERVGSPSSGKAETPTGGAGTSSVKKEPRRDSPGKVDAPPKKAPPPVDRENLIGIAARGLADRKRPAPGSLKDGFPMGGGGFNWKKPKPPTPRASDGKAGEGGRISKGEKGEGRSGHGAGGPRQSAGASGHGGGRGGGGLARAGGRGGRGGGARASGGPGASGRPSTGAGQSGAGQRGAGGVAVVAAGAFATPTANGGGMPTTQAYIGPAVWVDGTDGPAEELHSLAKKIQDRHLGAIQTDTGNSKEKGGGQQSTLLQVFEARLRQLDAMIDAVAAAETRLRSAATAVHAAAKKDVVHVPGGAPGLLRGTGAGA